MEPTLIAQALGLSAVVFASLLDLRGLERQAATRRARARQTREASRCPFCHRGFEPGDAVLPCEGCGARHHTECWAESPRCGIYGCAARAPHPAEAAVDACAPRGAPRAALVQDSPRG